MLRVHDTLEESFRRHAPALKSFLYRMTASEQDAEDLVSETYLRAAEKLELFERKSSFKTWLFTIATNLARDHYRAQRRWSVYAQDQAKAKGAARVLSEDLRAHQRADPEIQFEMREHIDFCFTCMMKTLPLLEQIVLMLANIYDFQVSEIAVIVDKSEASVKHLLRQARNTMKEIFENRCALVSKQGVCYQCSELNGILNPKQSSQVELLKLELVKQAKKDSTDQLGLLDLRLELIRGISPTDGKNAALQQSHMRMLRAAIQDD
ncbi:MAG: RNA polymerase sigma factor [Chloroflexi bacterium]|nr:RNA polymerase sigma factor [Chloroflexota bacterium]